MRDWGKFIEDAVNEIKAQTGDKQVFAGLSGGVDSTVAAVLTHKAVGTRLSCLLIDHGLMRKNECDEVERVFRNQFSIGLCRVEAQDSFFDLLKGITDPEQKRKIIGEKFIRTFEKCAASLSGDKGPGFLMQGTIYTDVSESASIKSHHNVGGLPEAIAFEGLVEPLRPLYKHEVRELGDALGIPRSFTRRQPFPGPGLGVRILGEVTREKADVLRQADAIFRDVMENNGIDSDQYFAVHTGLQSVGVKDGARTYGHVIALRAVTTSDLVKADWTRIPHDVLAIASGQITARCPEVTRVVYDITSKPPGTIEWE
jgi:GMP synthase (glutamine-hydrolysing)